MSSFGSAPAARPPLAAPGLDAVPAPLPAAPPTTDHPPPFEAWNGAEVPPAPGLDGATLLAEAVRWALLAPSGHNAQPWRFVLRAVAPDGGAAVLELRADRTRALPVVDPDDRALVIGCGAALALLAVAMRRAGVEPEIARLPDPDDPDLLARVRCGPPHAVGAEERARFAAIARRRTVRHAFAPRPVEPETAARLRDAARERGVWFLELASVAAREALVALVVEGDRRQAADPAFRAELARWIHPNRSHARDGMPGSAHGAGDLASLAAPFVIRTFDWGNGQAARDRQLAEGSPMLAVLGTDADGAADWLRTGEALGDLLLAATDAGLRAAYLNQPVEVPALRERLRALVREATGRDVRPQLVLRLGHGPDAPPTPRRPTDEVLERR